MYMITLKTIKRVFQDNQDQNQPPTGENGSQEDQGQGRRTRSTANEEVEEMDAEVEEILKKMGQTTNKS